MWEAAPHHRNRLRLLLAAVLAQWLSRPPAADPRPDAFVLPEFWGVAANASFRSATFTRMQRAGINTVVIDSRGLPLSGGPLASPFWRWTSVAFIARRALEVLGSQWHT
jgi:hypothetical protein